MISINEIEKQFNIKVHQKPSTNSQSSLQSSAEKERNRNDNLNSNSNDLHLCLNSIDINDLSNRLCTHMNVTDIHIESNFDLRYLINVLLKANLSTHASANESLLLQQLNRSQFYWCYPQQDIDLIFSMSTHSYHKHLHSNDLYHISLPNRNDAWFELPEINSVLTCLIQDDNERMQKKNFLMWQKSFYSILQVYISSKIEGSDICQFHLMPLSNSTTQVILGQFTVMFIKSATTESANISDEYTVILHGVSKKLARRIYDMRMSQKPIIIDCNNIESNMMTSSHTTTDYNSINIHIDQMKSSLFNANKLSSQGKLERSNKGLTIYVQGDKLDITLLADVICDTYLTYITSASTYAKCKYFSLPRIISSNIEFFMSVQKPMSITKIDCRHLFQSIHEQKEDSYITTETQPSSSQTHTQTSVFNETMTRPHDDKTHKIQLQGYFLPDTIQLLATLLQSMAFRSYYDTQTSHISSQQYINDKNNNDVGNNRSNLERINIATSTSMLFNMQSSRRVQVPSNKILSNHLKHKDYNSSTSITSTQNKLTNNYSNNNKISLKNPLTIVSRKIQPLIVRQQQQITHSSNNGDKYIDDSHQYSDVTLNDISSKMNDTDDADRYMSSKSWLKNKKSNRHRTPFFQIKLDYCPHLNSILFMKNIKKLIKLSKCNSTLDKKVRMDEKDTTKNFTNPNYKKEHNDHEHNDDDNCRTILQLPEIENFDVFKFPFNTATVNANTNTSGNTSDKVSPVVVESDAVCTEIRWCYTDNHKNTSSDINNNNNNGNSTSTTKEKIEQNIHLTKKRTMAQIEEEKEDASNNNNQESSHYVSKKITVCYSTPPKHAFLFYPMLTVETEVNTELSTSVALPHESVNDNDASLPITAAVETR